MNSPLVGAPKRTTTLPSLWTGNYREGGFPLDADRHRPPSLPAAGPVLPSPMSPRAAPMSFGTSPAVLHPPDPIGDSVNELGRALIHSLNQGMGRRLSAADSSSSPASSPMSGVFDRMATADRATSSVYSANTSLLLSGVSQADVKSPVERRKSAVAEHKQPSSIFVTAVPLRRLSNGDMPVDESQPDRVIIAAGVIPRHRNRSRFEMKRHFDLAQIRRSIAGPPRRLSGASGRRSSTIIRPINGGVVADAGGAAPANTRPVSKFTSGGL